MTMTVYTDEVETYRD